MRVCWAPRSLPGPLLPTGNPAPDFYDKDRPRANLYTNSIVALDVRAGKLVWYDQAVPHDVREYDLTHVAPVLTTTVGGQQLMTWTSRSPTAVARTQPDLEELEASSSRLCSE